MEKWESQLCSCQALPAKIIRRLSLYLILDRRTGPLATVSRNALARMSMSPHEMTREDICHDSLLLSFRRVTRDDAKGQMLPRAMLFTRRRRDVTLTEHPLHSRLGFEKALQYCGGLGQMWGQGRLRQ